MRKPSRQPCRAPKPISQRDFCSNPWRRPRPSSASPTHNIPFDATNRFRAGWHYRQGRSRLNVAPTGGSHADIDRRHDAVRVWCCVDQPFIQRGGTPHQAKLSPCKLTSDDSHGALSMFELSVGPKTGPVRHVHRREDEWHYVAAGNFVFEFGDEKFQLPIGGSMWMPRDIPHV